MKTKKKSREAKRTVNGEISPADPLTERGAELPLRVLVSHARSRT